MGIIETEYSEIRDITKGILAGTVDKEIAALALKAYSESGKRVDQLLKVYQMIIHQKATATKVVEKNIISEGTAIDMGLSEIQEAIKCPAKGDLLVSRPQCLDYSGEEGHIYTCQNCEHFAKTRKQLYPH